MNYKENGRWLCSCEIQLYFEHADKYGPLLNLKVAQKKTAAGPVPMVRSIGLLNCRQLILC